MDAVELLEAELRGFRKTLDMTQCPRLVHLLGAGEPVHAQTRLFEIDAFFPDDREVQVALLTMQGAGNVLHRFNAAAELLGGIDQRNVRPYSDRGIRKIAQFIATGEVLDWPELDVFLVQLEPRMVYVWYTLRMREGVGLERNRPRVTVNGTELEQSLTPLKDDGYHGVIMDAQSFDAEDFSTLVSWNFATHPLLSIHTKTVDKGKAWLLRSSPHLVAATLRDA